MRFFVANDFPQSPDTVLQNLTTTLKTQMAGLAQTSTLRRGKVTQMKLGPVGAPVGTDCNILWKIQRQTANDGAGAGTVTPNYVPALEAGSAPTAGSLWRTNYTSEPTYALQIWTQYLNQHSGFVWYAPDEIGVPWPAVNNNGLAYMASSSNFNSTVVWGIDFDE